jgi:hypothetical protein
MSDGKDEKLDEFVTSASLGLTIYTAIENGDTETLEAVEEGYSPGEQFAAVLDLVNLSLDMLGLAIGKEDEELYASMREALTRVQGER